METKTLDDLTQDYEDMLSNLETKENLPAWFTMTFKNILKKTVTIDEWNTFMQYIQNNSSDAKSIATFVSDMFEYLQSASLVTQDDLDAIDDRIDGILDSENLDSFADVENKFEEIDDAKLEVPTLKLSGVSGSLTDEQISLVKSNKTLIVLFESSPTIEYYFKSYVQENYLEFTSRPNSQQSGGRKQVYVTKITINCTSKTWNLVGNTLLDTYPYQSLYTKDDLDPTIETADKLNSIVGEGLTEDLSVTFGTSGNYKTVLNLSNLTEGADYQDNGANNTQFKQGSILNIPLEKGGNFTLQGFTGYSSFEVSINGQTYTNLTGTYLSPLAEYGQTATIKALDSSNYYISLTIAKYIPETLTDAVKELKASMISLSGTEGTLTDAEYDAILNNKQIHILYNNNKQIYTYCGEDLTSGYTGVKTYISQYYKSQRNQGDYVFNTLEWNTLRIWTYGTNQKKWRLQSDYIWDSAGLLNLITQRQVKMYLYRFNIAYYDSVSGANLPTVIAIPDTGNRIYTKVSDLVKRINELYGNNKYIPSTSNGGFPTSVCGLASNKLSLAVPTVKQMSGQYYLDIDTYVIDDNTTLTCDPVPYENPSS